MRNLTTFFNTLLIILVATGTTFCQPELTVWRVAADHQDNHEHNLGEDEKIQYDCGAYYYLTHTGDDVVMHFALRNDGDQDLELSMPLQLTQLTSEYLQISSQPGSSHLAPGEETMFSITYLSPKEYVPNQKGGISFMSNDLVNPMCGFSIDVGITYGMTSCVCEDGSGPVTVINGFKASPGDEENGVIFPIQPDQFLLHYGECLETDECPSAESLACYYTPYLPNFRTDIAGGSSGGWVIGPFPVYLEVAPGYCPCIIGTDFCVNNNSDPMLPPPTDCPGDPRTYNVTNCWSMDSTPASPSDDFNLPDSYTYEWCTDGVGTFDPSTGLLGTITGWFAGDFVFVKVTNEEGCLGVGYSPIFNPYMMNSLIIQLQNEFPTCIHDDLTLCIDNGPLPVTERNINNTRAVDITWSTNGDGEFSPPFMIEGQHCITISGFDYGDKVFAVDHSGGADLPEDCLPTGIFNSFMAPFFPCLNAEENVGLGGISLDDPCNCDDPLNIPAPPGGPTAFFHDILSIEDLPPFINATVIPGINFLDAGGAPFAGPFNVTTDMYGRAEVDFWHAPDAPGFANITSVFSNPREFISSVCAACAPIPTIGQWGMIILGFLVLIFGIVYIRKSIQAGITS